MCVGYSVGVEVVIYVMSEVFMEEEIDGDYVIDVSNVLNLMNCFVVLYKI